MRCVPEFIARMSRMLGSSARTSLVQKSTSSATVCKAAMCSRSPSAPRDDESTPFDLADTRALEQRLRDAGFTGFQHRSVTVCYDFPSSDAFLAFRRELSGIEQRMTHVAAERRAAAWGAVAEALKPYRTPDGRIVMENLSPCLGCRLA